MAHGSMEFTTDQGAKVNGHWRMKGLSKDPSYLKHEVNLKLTEAGHLVGKMAYFHLMVNDGEALENPVYVKLTPHQRSKALDIHSTQSGQKYGLTWRTGQEGCCIYSGVKKALDN